MSGPTWPVADERAERETLRAIRRRMLRALREGWQPYASTAAYDALPAMIARFHAPEVEQFGDVLCRRFYAALNDEPDLEEMFLDLVLAHRVPVGGPSTVDSRVVPVLPMIVGGTVPLAASLADYLRRSREDVRDLVARNQGESLAAAAFAQRRAMQRTVALMSPQSRSADILFEVALTEPAIELQIGLEQREGQRWQVRCNLLAANVGEIPWSPILAEGNWRVSATVSARQVELVQVDHGIYRAVSLLTSEELLDLTFNVVAL